MIVYLPSDVSSVSGRVPIGVVLFFYESRPNVTVDAAGALWKLTDADVYLTRPCGAAPFGPAMVHCVLPAVRTIRSQPSPGR